jgi:hypothetical protein
LGSPLLFREGTVTPVNVGWQGPRPRPRTGHKFVENLGQNGYGITITHIIYKKHFHERSYTEKQTARIIIFNFTTK